jgi:hypothetical protein
VDECIHGLAAGTCSLCSGREKNTTAVQEDSAPFVARYDGACPACRDTITAGSDRIILRSFPSGSRLALHESCAD